MCASFSLRLRFGGSADGTSAMAVSALCVRFEGSGAEGGAIAAVAGILGRDIGPIVSSRSTPVSNSAARKTVDMFRKGNRLEFGALARTFERG